MNIVNSVLGGISTSNLGFVLAHEHIMVAPAGVLQQYPELLGGGNLLERIINDLQQAKEGGIDTIIDTTTTDLGRDIELLTEASRRSGVNIIACTGWWLDIPRWFAGVSANQLADLFARDVEKGFAGTNVKAGILKASSDAAGVTPSEEVVLRAVCRAHLKTGAPIVLHSYSPGQVGRQQLAILKQEGVDLKRVKMDHSNDTTDVEYLTWLLEQGCYLGMDRYPGYIVSPAARTKTMKALIDAGYARRLCPSHDRAILSVVPAGREPVEEEALKIESLRLYVY